MKYVGSEQKTVSTADAAKLIGVDERSVRRYVEAGKITAVNALNAYGGGAGGTVYRIAVDSLPPHAQIAYWQQDAMAELGHGGQEFDLVGYRERHGEAGMEKLRARQKAALAAHGLRRQYDENGLIGYTDALRALAAEMKVPYQTLYRWERGYAENGLAALARKGREDAGQSRSACLLARDYLEHLMCHQNRLSQSYALEKLQKLAGELGCDACETCPYRRASEARNREIAEGHELPLCDQAANGLIAPENRHAVNRMMKLVPESVLAYKRYGSRYWDAKFLQKVERKKPQLVNDVWFGDHHMLNLFVADRDGRIVRPWLTAWMDAATGVIVGWMLTLEPNSDTIAESFARGAVATVGSVVRGLPRLVYIDNGKDYRSLRFEGSQTVEYDVGKLNLEFCGKSMLETLGVSVKHAIAYWAWSKPIERMFGTLDRRWMRDFPGWCGDGADQRPQELGRQIKKLMESGDMMTFETFAACFKRDVIDNYHNYRSAEDGKTPMERYLGGQRARTDDPDWATMAMLKSQNATRKVTTQGVKIGGIKYQDRALADVVGKDVTVLYQRGENQSVTVLYNGRFVCEAERADKFAMHEQDAERISAMMEDKAVQRKTVKTRLAAVEQRVRGITREAYTEEIDEQRDRALAKMGSTAAKQVLAAKGEVAKRAKRRAGQLDAADERVHAHWRDMGRAVLSRTKEG